MGFSIRNGLKGIGLIMCLLFTNADLMAQRDYYFSLGTSVITPKQHFVYRPEGHRLAEPALHGIDSRMGLVGSLGMRVQKKWLRYDLAFKTNYYRYSFTPILDTNDRRISTRVSFPVYCLNIIPSWYFEKVKIAAGVGVELQYAGKPVIRSTGEELHNIVDENKIGFGGIFHLQWDFVIGEKDFFLTYQYIRYPDGFLPFQVQLLYNQNHEDLFVHVPKFNSHLIRIGYVFR